MSRLVVLAEKEGKKKKGATTAPNTGNRRLARRKKVNQRPLIPSVRGKEKEKDGKIKTFYLLDGLKREKGVTLFVFSWAKVWKKKKEGKK